jgi:molecular chaperone GrpE
MIQDEDARAGAAAGSSDHTSGPHPTAATPPELPAATAEERIAALEAERNEIKDRMLRTAAEFDNWKKRAAKEQNHAVATAREDVFKEMLDVVDNLEHALGLAGSNGIVDSAALLNGVELVLRLLRQKLERHGVKPFASKGQPFDPRLHEAISRVESPEAPAGAVAAELQKGYRIGDRLLRPARVSVSTGPESTIESPQG